MEPLKNNFAIYKVILSEHFKRQLKAFTKKDDQLLTALTHRLEAFPEQPGVSIGKGVFKIRLQAQGRGKSGGYRLYIFLGFVQGILVPFCIFSKTERPDVSQKELLGHLRAVKIELGLSS